MMLPDDLEYIGGDSLVDNHNSGITIVAFINGDCYCGIEDLAAWRSLLKKQELKDIPVSFYVYSANYFQFEEMATELIGEDLCIYFDRKNEFRTKNGLDESNQNLAFLLDSEYKILFQGDLLRDARVRQQFIDVIKINEEK